MSRWWISAKETRPRRIIPLHPPHPATEPPDVLLGQQAVRRQDPVAEEPDAVLDREDHALLRVKPQPQANQKVPDPFPHVGQVPLVVGEHQEIIDVADVALDPQPVLDEVIERVEVDVGEELAGLVADGDAPPPFAGREQVVAGKPVQDLFLRVAVVDDPVRPATARPGP